MKIALVTIHKSLNYGAVLQAYATVKVLSSYGEVTLVDYVNPKLDRQFDLLRFELSSHGFLKFIHDLLRLPYRLKVIDKFNKFFRKKFKLTRRIYSYKEDIANLDSFDVYVTGSDQVWNPEVVSEGGIINPFYFLMFAPDSANKISYASSFGDYCFSENEKKRLKDYLGRYRSLSSRESDGVQKIKGILPERHVQNVLDPTLLIKKDDWVNELNISSKIKYSNYILVYTVPKTHALKDVVSNLREKLGLKVILIDQMLRPFCKADVHLRSVGIEEFLCLFKSASFVITDSFHGTCFSVNFEKPFFTVLPGRKSNRIISLLSLLKLEDRCVESVKDLVHKSLDMDYSISNEILNALREESEVFIKNSICSNSNDLDLL